MKECAGLGYEWELSGTRLSVPPISDAFYENGPAMKGDVAAVRLLGGVASMTCPPHPFLRTLRCRELHVGVR
jgi:hypothetical protein